MGLFDNAIKAAKNVGNAASKAAANVGSSVGTFAKDQGDLNQLNREINVIDTELNAAYQQIGKKYVQHVLETSEMGGLEVSDILGMIDPKLTRKIELEAKVVEVSKRMKQQDLMRDKSRAEEVFANEKSKLDKGLAMDILSQEDYDMKLEIASKKLCNFEQVRKFEHQYELGIIDINEKNSLIQELS